MSMKCCRMMSAHIIFCTAILCLFMSCQKNKPPVKASNKTTLFNLYLGAHAPEYQAVNINIQQILVKASSDSNDNGGWIQIPLKRKGKYNLLHFTNGRDTLLGATYLPSGSISQIRLILGEGNELVLSDNTIIPLELPSELQSGLKMNIQANLMPDIPYDQVLDFNITRSILQGGKIGPFILSPVIQTVVKEKAGAIEGAILPDSALLQITAISTTDTSNAVPDTTGHYKFSDLSPGCYTLYYIPGLNINYKSDTLDSIQVYEGKTTVIDTLWLKPLND